MILAEKGCVDSDEGAAVNSSKACAISESGRTSIVMVTKLLSSKFIILCEICPPIVELLFQSWFDVFMTNIQINHPI